MNEFDPLAPSRIPMSERVATHDLVRVAVQGDTASDYSMLVPKGWSSATRFGTPARCDGTPEPIGAFVTLPRPTTPGLLVTKTVVGVHVHARDFLCHRIAQEGGIILGETIAHGPYGPRLQIAARMRETGDLRVATLHVDGGRVFVVDAIANERMYPDARELFAPCGPSFALAQPTGVARLGRTRVLTAGRLRIELPSDWATRTVGRSHAVECRLPAPARMHACVRLRSGATEITEHALAARWRSALSRSGRSPHAGHERVSAPYVVDAPCAATSIELRGCGDDGTLVLTATTRRVGDHVVDIGVLAPPLHVDVPSWLRARGLIELALASASVVPAHSGSGTAPRACVLAR
jgi:hypothetical protein